MEKTVIIYASTHHGNTRKLVEAICGKYGVAAIDVQREQRVELSSYDVIGFASGIDFGEFYAPVTDFLRQNLPEKKKVFFLYTCAKTSRNFTKTLREEVQKRAATVLGEYGCRGYNTYGPWKLIGGMNKGHPTREEIAGALEFYETIRKKDV